MDLKAFIFVLISSVFALAASSQGTTTDPRCLTKLVPCQRYLKPPSSPPSTCCLPLASMIKDDVACLCSIFGNSDMLKQFNITQAEALELPKACGAKANISLCKSGTGAPTSPSTPSSPSTTSNSSSPSDSTTKGKNAAHIAYYGLMSYFFLFIVTLILAAV